MKEYRKVVRLSKLDYYKTHLSLINCLLPILMTPKEIEVIAAFMGLEGDIAEYRFGKTGKKIIMSQLSISPSGLSNYLGDLTEKGFLRKVSHDNYTILPVLIPADKEQLYIFKLIKTEEDIINTKPEQNTNQVDSNATADTSQV